MTLLYACRWMDPETGHPALSVHDTAEEARAAEADLRLREPRIVHSVVHALDVDLEASQ